MPILNETAKVSVDFPYEWENPVLGEKELYQLKFVHNEYGPVLQIFQGPYEPIELPAIMFLEVAEFLVRNNYIKGMPSVSQPKQITGGVLPTPTIGRKPRIGNTPPAPQLQPRRGIGIGGFQSQDDNDGSDVLVLRENTQEDNGSTQIAAATVDAKIPAPISTEEAQKILQARLAAKAKANTVGKKVRSNPKYENGTGPAVME